MILYVHNKCSTCKKALQFLESKNIKVKTVDITLQAPSLDELKRMLHFQNGNIKKLLNTSGMLYREMGLSKKIGSLSENEVLDLLSRSGMLVKRPFLLGKNFGLVGFNLSDYEKAAESFL